MLESGLERRHFGHRLIRSEETDAFVCLPPDTGTRKFIVKGSVLAFAGERVENNFGKAILSTPDRDSNLDLPVIGSLVYYESSALNHAATTVDNRLLRRASTVRPMDLPGCEILRSAKFVCENKTGLLNVGRHAECILRVSLPTNHPFQPLPLGVHPNHFKAELWFDGVVLLQTILLGDSGVGKTSLLVQFDTGRFQTGNFSATVGIGFTRWVSESVFGGSLGNGGLGRSPADDT
uniref:Uncharacterized protein n=1 Tax=Timema genevievae TaxID=629358 RepID=A0A7R9JYV2_TIMGE|nr:unnamed protein product [Timema genevievae]